MKKPVHHGTTAKHSPPKRAPAHQAHGKHKAAPAKHTAKTRRRNGPVAVGKGPAAPKKARPRKLTPGAVACCSAEAVAAAARLAGWEVTDEDVLDLYARCADGPSSGFTIAAALSQGWRFGGVWDFTPLDALDEIALPLVEQGQFAAQEHLVREADHVVGGDGHVLILGVGLPGPHAVTVAPDGCWVSWGQHYDPAEFPDAVIEEAWAVSFG